MAKNNTKNNTNTTKEFVDVEDIRDNVVVLKNGSLRLLLKVGAVNFDLKSEDEQKAIVIGFQNFLNSIDFPVQISVQSRKININPYLDYLNKNLEMMDTELLRIQAEEYIKFVTGLTELANIMSKNFYVVVPFYLVEAPASQKGFVGSIQSIISPSKAAKKLTDAEFAEYKNQITQRASLIGEGLASLGLQISALQESDLRSLFHNTYNGQ